MAPMAGSGYSSDWYGNVGATHCLRIIEAFLAVSSIYFRYLLCIWTQLRACFWLYWRFLQPRRFALHSGLVDFVLDSGFSVAYFCAYQFFCIVPLNLGSMFVFLSDLLFLCILGVLVCGSISSVGYFWTHTLNFRKYNFDLFLRNITRRVDASRASLVPDFHMSTFYFQAFFDIFHIIIYIFFVRPWGEAHGSAQACFFPHAAAFWGVGRGQTFSHSLSRELPQSCDRVEESTHNHGVFSPTTE